MKCFKRLPFVFIPFMMMMLLSQNLCAQAQLKKFIRENAVSIEDGNNGFDFRKIAEGIGNKRFVFLGEQNHGDLTTLQFKSKLVKYLHDSLGFNVLAFEGDFFSLNYHDDSVRIDKRDSSFYRNNILNVWSGCRFYDEFIKLNFLAQPEGRSRLILSGFDSQLGAGIFQSKWTFYLRGMIERSTMSLQLRSAYHERIKSFDPSGFEVWEMDSDQCTNLIGFVDSLIHDMGEETTDNFDIHNLQNLKAFALQWLLMKRNSDDYAAVRDARMARNFEYLQHVLYPDEKIIVWAHSGHLLNLNIHVNNGVYKNMGQLFFEDSVKRASSYILAFTSAAGTYGMVHLPVSKIPDCRFNSFESYFKKNINYGFIDFKSYNLNNDVTLNYYMKALGHDCWYTNWRNAFDGVVFIRNMLPCSE